MVLETDIRRPFSYLCRYIQCGGVSDQKSKEALYDADSYAGTEIGDVRETSSELNIPRDIAPLKVKEKYGITLEGRVEASKTQVYYI